MTPIVSDQKPIGIKYKYQNNKKLEVLNSWLQTYQILPNDNRMLILCLS